MSRKRFTFENRRGHELSGSLELPDEGESDAVAVFAHCFTCGKDIRSANTIADALTRAGIGVLRFDFTGLGGSEGDFANTNFSSNVQDLEDAIDRLTEQLVAPRLLIGHSLGGAAALVAAANRDSIEAVVTIAAPSSAEHIQHLFADQRCDIRRDGEADVDIGGRPFRVTSQLLDDLEHWSRQPAIGDVGKPLLIFHSPLDRVVGIDEAAQLYKAAKHPKSFISLDKADHLLTEPSDARYVGTTIAAWASRYLDLEQGATRSAGDTQRPGIDTGEVLVTEKDNAFLRGLYAHHHHSLADEPESVGGSDKGPNPYDYLLMALGSCTSMTLRQYANHKKLPVRDIEVRLRHSREHARDCSDCESRDAKIDRIDRVIDYQGELDAEQHKRFLQIADRCPVHRTLKGEIRVVTRSGRDE